MAISVHWLRAFVRALFRRKGQKRRHTMYPELQLTESWHRAVERYRKQNTN